MTKLTNIDENAMVMDEKHPDKQAERMPVAILAEMFKSGIVVITEEREVTRAAKSDFTGEPLANPVFAHENEKMELPLDPRPLVWLGNFSRRVLVVVHDPTALHLNDEDFALLGKIIGAVKLSVADIAVVNTARHNLTYESLNHLLPAQVALYFGVEPVSIGVPFKVPMFQVQPWNQTKFLYVPALQELNKQTPEGITLKKSLWESLKKIFE